jgi:hypothetical protein
MPTVDSNAAASPVEIRLARTPEELQTAYGLLYDEYIEKGYQDPDPSRLRFPPHYALPSANTFVAIRGEELLGTVTLLSRGSLGLPMEAEYAPEIFDLCSRGRVPIEMSGLAARRGGRSAVLSLIRDATAFAIHSLRATDLCIAVNPAHEGFYRKGFLFEPMGPARSCLQVKGAPAVALKLELAGAVERCAERHPSGVIGRRFAPDQGVSYEGLSESFRRQLFVATLARLSFVRRLLTRPATEDSPARRWEPAQTRIIVRQYEKATRRYERKKAVRGGLALARS